MEETDDSIRNNNNRGDDRPRRRDIQRRKETMNKPAVFNYEKAVQRIADLEQQLKENQRNESFWHEDEDGIWCDNCQIVYYYDENLKEGETLFEFCPSCGSYMRNYKGGK